jgi:hypothetical protein
MSKKTYVVKKISSPIKIDGKVQGKSVWKKIKPITDFETPWARQGDLRQRTECRMCWDDKYLYLGYIAYDKDIRFVKRPYKGDVCLDDLVEIFIDPTPKDNHYYGYEVSASNTYLDYECRFYRRFNPKWVSKGFKSATQIKKGKYFTCEMAIPFEDIKKTPKDGTKWKTGLYRCDYNVVKGVYTEEYQLWKKNSSKYPDFHRRESFGTLIFKD